ncbi:MAG TPA: fatty acid desaturase [Steroidobacteraceae bacterium]|nr:fatty acid desaturase [Steroidobacteraceae bacterium]
MNNRFSISARPSVAATDVSKENVTRFGTVSVWRAWWQVANSFVPYALLWVAMVYALAVSYWLILPFAILAAGFLARIFIIFHDCGHASFLQPKRANNVLGAIAGLLNLTPFQHWRWQHALHHGTAGNLDRRGSGDIWTLTVQEYIQSTRWKRFAYRLARNPIVLFAIAPLYVFVIHHRFAATKAPKRERQSVARTNLALLGITLVMSLAIGLKAFLLIQLTVSAFAGALGLWLFYVQHQFEGAYWARGEKWNYTTAALEGSSYYKLPKVLQWFTGNIGFHHIHHLSPRIPNYYLQRCHEADPFFRTIKPVTFFASLKSLTYRLWDEQRQVFVGFRYLKPALL